MDLHSGYPYWLLADGLAPPVPPLDSDLTCDAAIVGAGITGAFVADELIRRGRSVAVLDRRDLGMGSTVASTALLVYEIDVPLHELAIKVGRAHAERAYRMGVEAIEQIASLCATIECPFERRGTLYFTRRAADTGTLRQELEARRAAGLAVEWLDAGELESGWGLHAAGAIRSAAGAQTDPYLLCAGLLRRSASAGAAVHDRTTVTGIEVADDGATLRTDRGPSVRARDVIWATGYESASSLPRGLVVLHSTYAIASEPVAPVKGQWSRREMLWEHADPYLYARWQGDRLLIGGEDVPFRDERARDRLLERKANNLAAEFREVAPGLVIEPACAWTGTFGVTDDGLGYIGGRDGEPRTHYALGFGGNGITCSAMAAKIIADRITGVPNADAAIFRFER